MTLINSLINENPDVTIRDYLDLMAELKMIERAYYRVTNKRVNEIIEQLENFENE